MKKFLLVLFLVLILPICSAAILNMTKYQYLPTPADSGFDSDYGGGDYDSSGGGDSWGSNDNYSGGSWSSSDPDDLIPFVIILISSTVVVTLIYTIVHHHEKRRNTQARINSVLKINFNLCPGDGSKNEIVQAAYKNYVDIQIAWMNRDLTPVRHLLTDEIYNMYQMQLQTLIEDNQINVMKDFNFVCGTCLETKTTKKMETIKILLCVECKDYIQKADSKTVVNGDKSATITYIYELTFVRDLTSNKSTNCPACGAEVKNQMSTNCPYCNNNLTLISSELTLSNKRILHQFKK